MLLLGQEHRQQTWNMPQPLPLPCAPLSPATRPSYTFLRTRMETSQHCKKKQAVSVSFQLRLRGALAVRALHSQNYHKRNICHMLLRFPRSICVYLIHLIEEVSQLARRHGFSQALVAYGTHLL